MDLETVLKALKPEHTAVIQKALDEGIAKATAAETAAATAKKAEEDALTSLAKAKEETAPVGTTTEEILKSVKDPAVRSLLESQIAKTKAAEDQVRKAHDSQLSAEAIVKAKEVPNLGAEETAVTEVYKKLKGLDTELCEEVFGIFKASSALIAEGGVFTEVGKGAGSQSGEGSSSESGAWDKIEAAADVIVKSTNVSKQQAIADVIKSQPALYDEYIKAQRG